MSNVADHEGNIQSLILTVLESKANLDFNSLIDTNMKYLSKTLVETTLCHRWILILYNLQCGVYLAHAKKLYEEREHFKHNNQ